MKPRKNHENPGQGTKSVIPHFSYRAWRGCGICSAHKKHLRRWVRSVLLRNANKPFILLIKIKYFKRLPNNENSFDSDICSVSLRAFIVLLFLWTDKGRILEGV